MLLDDLVEDHLRAELLLAGLGDLRAVRVVLQTALALEVGVDLVLDQLLGHGDVGEFDELLDELVARGGTLREHGLLRHSLGQALAQLGDGVELAGHLREVIVGLGELALLHGGDGHGDLGLFTGVIAADQLRAERGLLARGERVDGLIDAFEQLARADLVRHALRAVDLGAVDRRHEVELDEVAGGGGTVDGHERAEAGAEVLELGVERGLVGLDGVDLDGDGVIGGQFELGAHVDLDGHLQVAREVLLVGPLDDLGRRTAHDAHLVGVHGLAVELVQALADGVLEDCTAADPLVDDGRRHLALAEAGDLHVLRDVLVSVRDARLELLGGDRDVQLHPGGAQRLDGAGDHSCCLLKSRAHARALVRSVLGLGGRVGATGFEPAASRSQSGRSTKLSYAPGAHAGERRKTAVVSLADNAL